MGHVVWTQLDFKNFKSILLKMRQGDFFIETGSGFLDLNTSQNR